MADPPQAVTEKQNRALALHLQGASYAQIAERLDYSSASGAHAAVRAALADRVPTDGTVEAYRVEAARLDLLIAALTPSVRAGDVQSIDRYVKIIERRTALSALMDASAKTGTGHGAAEGEGGATAVDELNRRRAARGATTPRSRRAKVDSQ